MINLAVRTISNTCEDQRIWQAYIQSHSRSTTYHSIAWKSIFENSFGYQSWYLIAQKESNKQIVGCLPLFLVSSPLSRRLVSIPFRDRGGILWDTPDACGALMASAIGISRQKNVAFLELKSLQAYPSELVQKYGLQETFYWIHSCIELCDLDAETYFKKLGSKTRNMIRQATRSSLSFEDVTHKPNSIKIWYRIYLETQKKLGLPPFPQSFFSNMLNVLRDTNGIRVFFVWKGDQCVSATIVLLHKTVAIYGYSASLPSAQCLRPNDFMIFNLVKWSLKNNVEFLDLASDSPKQDNLLFFKKKWLSKQEEIPVYILGKASPWVSDSSDRRYELIRQGFRYLPLSVLSKIGNLSAKYFG